MLEIDAEYCITCNGKLKAGQSGFCSQECYDADCATDAEEPSWWHGPDAVPEPAAEGEDHP